MLSKIFDILDNEIREDEIKDLIDKFMLMDDCLYNEEFNNDDNTEKEIFKENSPTYNLNLNDIKNPNQKLNINDMTHQNKTKNDILNLVPLDNKIFLEMYLNNFEQKTPDLIKLPNLFVLYDKIK